MHRIMLPLHSLWEVQSHLKSHLTEVASSLHALSSSEAWATGHPNGSNRCQNLYDILYMRLEYTNWLFNLHILDLLNF